MDLLAVLAIDLMVGCMLSIVSKDCLHHPLPCVYKVPPSSRLLVFCFKDLILHSAHENVGIQLVHLHTHGCPMDL